MKRSLNFKIRFIVERVYYINYLYTDLRILHTCLILYYYKLKNKNSEGEKLEIKTN